MLREEREENCSGECQRRLAKVLWAYDRDEILSKLPLSLGCLVPSRLSDRRGPVISKPQDSARQRKMP